MAKTTKENIQLSVEINGSKAGETLKDIKKEVKLLKTELDKIPVGSDEFNKKLEELRGKESVLKNISSGAKDTKENMTGILPALKPLQGGIDMVSGAFGGLMKAMGPLLLIFTALKGAWDFLSGAVEQFDEAEKSANQLRAAFKGNEAAVQDLVKVSKELEAVTETDDNEIQKQMARMKGFSMTAEEIKKLTPLMQDWASFMEKDMQGAVDDLGAAIEGTAGPFEDLGIRFDESTPKAEKLAMIQKVLSERIGGTAQVAAQAGTGGWTILKNQFGEVMEKIGGVVVRIGNALVPALKIAVQFVGVLVDYIAKGIDSLTWLGDKISWLYSSVKTFFTGSKASMEDIANNYRKLSGDAQKSYEALMKSQGVNVEEMKRKAKELTIAEALELKKRLAQTIEMYNAMSSEQQKAVGKQITALAMGNKDLEKLFNQSFANFKQAADKQAKEQAAKEKADYEAKYKDELESKRNEAKAKLEEMRATELNIRKLQAELIKDETTQKITLRKIQLEEEIAGIKGNAQQKLEQEKLLTEKANREIAELQKDLIKKMAQVIKDYYAFIAEVDESELEKEIKRRVQAEKIRLEKEKQRLEKEKASREESLKNIDYHEKQKQFFLEESFVTELEKIRGNEQAKSELESEYALKRLAIQEEMVRQKLDMLREYDDVEIERVTALQQQLLEIQKQRIATEEAAKEQNLEKTKEIEEKKIVVIKAVGDAVKETTELGIEMLGRDEAARKKNAQKIRDIQRSQIVAASLVEIAGIWKNNNSNWLNSVIPGWGFVQSIVETGLVLGRTAVGLSKLDAAFKYGKGGKLQGAYHSEGGNPILDGKTGEVIGEIEKDEVILSKETAKNNPIVDKLLYSSMFLGGKNIFANGGAFLKPVLPFMNNSPQVVVINQQSEGTMKVKAIVEHQDYTRVSSEMQYIENMANL